ncbi:hypothetical protein [Pseudomonas asiatica]|uniref:hypothetical protein n=1 Tax=Pseudomonas asiatica TaxID=2219225 RepID=UPI0010C04206|nr:hypothetical protein [Pseudomonas asiatica]
MPKIRHEGRCASAADVEILQDGYVFIVYFSKHLAIHYWHAAQDQSSPEGRKGTCHGKVYLLLLDEHHQGIAF